MNLERRYEFRKFLVRDVLCLCPQWASHVPPRVEVVRKQDQDGAALSVKNYNANDLND